MCTQNNKNIYLNYIFLLLSLLCVAAKQTNASEAGTAISQDLAKITKPALLANDLGATHERTGHPTWLPQALAATTLSLTHTGVLMLLSDALSAVWTAEPAGGMAPGLLTETENGQASIWDQFISASIAATSVPAPDAAPRKISQTMPLFGAHRVRFGKIASGARISDLIHKAANSGASAICTERCIDLAARLDLGDGDITNQIRQVSASINNLIVYRTDQQNHGRRDQWSTPDETLARLSGDCEDYAFLKMAVLARLGIPLSAMEIVVVKDTQRRLFHAVLSVSLEDRTLILDNMTDTVEADTEKQNYAPLFSISGSANYVFGYKEDNHKLAASLQEMARIAPGAGF